MAISQSEEFNGHTRLGQMLAEVGPETQLAMGATMRIGAPRRDPNPKMLLFCEKAAKPA